jgi:hypothetical protein
MKSIFLRTLALAAPLAAVAFSNGCSPEDPMVGNSGGSGGTGSSSGGTGNSAAGTNGNTAGTNSGTTAGTNSGTAGSGGSTGGSGTSTAGSGGTGTGGTGTGGMSTGGTSGGSGGSGGGTGGTGGASGGCTDKVACIDEVASAPSNFGNGGWKDSWWVTGCYKKVQHDCYLMEDAECGAKNDAKYGTEGVGARTVESWKLGGEPGQKYKVSFQFDAVTEAKRYQGGTRDVASVVGDPHTNTPLDMFYRGGTSPSTNYNVVKLTVFDQNAMPVMNYCMNAAPAEGDLGQWENHYTFLASYKKSIVVIGGGKVEHLVQDKNCHAIDNCGPNLLNGSTCAAERRLPGASANVSLPAKYQDPRDGTIKNTQDLAADPYPRQMPSQPWHSQSGHLKIIAIEKTNDPVDMKYPDPT